MDQSLKMAKVIRSISVFIAALILCSCVTNHNNPYPSDWPSPSVVNGDCEKISGLYNEAKPLYPDSSPPGLWTFVYPIPKESVSQINRTATSREIAIFFDKVKSLHIDYLIDGKVASSKIFTSSDYTCEKGVLNYTNSQRSG